MQEDQTPKSSHNYQIGTDDALETNRYQTEERTCHPEITQNRETSSPLQQITRIEDNKNTDRQQTHDHRQERQHLKRRKNSRIPPPALLKSRCPKQPPLLTDEERVTRP
ncbi:hypothetical protein Hamer_G026279 [Homarus americanus]|uniref:Uncharacterized protein n=1 Tax=Homarus americanus TaxID=6706 RepID=A0A8J5MJV0_HOMAM|nr:hypothetical protein Hamer_G026279 [Homarus americanus]